MSSLGGLHVGGALRPEESNKDAEETEIHIAGETYKPRLSTL